LDHERLVAALEAAFTRQETHPASTARVTKSISVELLMSERRQKGHLRDTLRYELTVGFQ